MFLPVGIEAWDGIPPTRTALCCGCRLRDRLYFLQRLDNTAKHYEPRTTVRAH